MIDAPDVNAVRLVVGGREFGGWLSVRIEAGIERLARSFEVGITARWPGPAAGSAPRIDPGDACEVFIGADRVLSGHVDAAPIDYDDTSWAMSISGRSRTADLVDCSAVNSPGQWRGLKLEDIAAALAQPYGVKVRAEVDTGGVISDHQVQVGESVFESLDRMMRLRQVLASDDATGALVLLSPGSGGAATTVLELGQNIKAGRAERDFSGVYGEYICKGQRAGTDDEYGSAVSEESATSIQSGISRRRVLILKQSGQADAGTCQDRVDYERSHRMGKAQESVHTVQGWRQGDGSLWVPNQVVRLRDGLMGIDADRLIVELAYVLDDRGSVCQMRLGPLDGYLTKAAKAAKKAKAGSGSGWADVK